MTLKTGKSKKMANVVKKNPQSMAHAREISWLYKILQDNKLSVEDKQEVFRKLAKELKKQELTTVK